MAKTTKSDIESTLWAAANTFRSKIDAANYKDYILSMLFIKYLSDVFKENIEKLEERYTDEIRLNRAIERLPFRLKKEFTYDYLFEKRNNSDIGE